MFKMLVYPNVDELKNNKIKDYREKILVSKRNQLKLSVNDIAKALNITSQAYYYIETNLRSGIQYQNKIKEILNLSDEEISLIFSYSGNLIEDAKEYALEQAKEYINNLLSIYKLYLNSHNYQDDIRYTSAIYLSLFHDINYSFNEKLTKPLTKNSLAIKEAIIEWLKTNLSFLGSEFECNESFFLKNTPYSSLKDIDNDLELSLTNTSNDYEEIIKKINIIKENNKTSSFEYFKFLLEKYDVKSDLLSNIGFSKSYIQKLSDGNKPFSNEVIYRLIHLLHINPTDASILKNNYEQQLVTEVAEAEYNEIINSLPTEIYQIINALNFYISPCYKNTEKINSYLCSNVLGDSLNIFKLEYFLSFFNIRIEYNTSIRISNRNKNQEMISISYLNKNKILNFSELKELKNSFEKFNNKIITKFSQMLKKMKK